MRMAFQSTDVITLDDKIVGINLGYDFAAEHEYGFSWAHRFLGRPQGATPDLMGIKARTTTQHDPHFKIELVTHKDEVWLRGMPFYSSSQALLSKELRGKSKDMSYYMQALAASSDKALRAGWSGEGGFCAVARSEAAKAALKVVYDALMADRCFINQASGLFGRGGLALIDARLIPAQSNQEMTDADVSAFNLKDAVAKDGILARLAAAGRRFYACSPRWVDEKKGTFQFWLNPCDQQDNESGWFGTTELDQWIDGKGPIPKKKVNVKQR